MDTQQIGMYLLVVVIGLGMGGYVGFRIGRSQNYVVFESGGEVCLIISPYQPINWFKIGMIFIVALSPLILGAILGAVYLDLISLVPN